MHNELDSVGNSSAGLKYCFDIKITILLINIMKSELENLMLDILVTMFQI